MNYLDIYFSRMNHMGETTAERIRNGGIRSYYKWLAESPETVRQLSVDRGVWFDAIIEENKDKEHKKIMFMHTANDIPLLIGDIMNWQLDNGQIEKWLIFQEEKKTNPTYRTFWIIRCNYLIKWVDQNGHVQESWSYLTSSLDSMIKGNYRTWHNVISPQPNKYMEVLMPRREVFRSTNFIVEEESWTVIEYDHTSVPGTVYLSLTEGKINSLTDDLVNNIADTDKIAVYVIDQGPEKQVFTVGDIIVPSFTLMKNGKISDEKIIFNISNNSIAKYVNGKIKAISAGETKLKGHIENSSEIIGEIDIIVTEPEAPIEELFSAYIEGPDKIKLDRQAEYTFKANKELVSTVTFDIDNTDLAILERISSNKCIIHTNDKNKLDSFILTVTYNNVEYKKNIQIIPLW